MKHDTQGRKQGCRPDSQPGDLEAAAEVSRGHMRGRGLDLRGRPHIQLGLHADAHTKAGREATR